MQRYNKLKDKTTFIKQKINKPNYKPYHEPEVIKLPKAIKLQKAIKLPKLDLMKERNEKIDLIDFQNFDGSFVYNAIVFDLIGVIESDFKQSTSMFENMSENEISIAYNTLIESYLTKLDDVKYKLILNKLKWYIANLVLKSLKVKIK
jgi:hypothetical protein